MMPRAATTTKRGAHVACTVAALHDGMPVAVAERRRHERGADDVRNRLSCAAVVMRGTSGAVPAGEDWAWTTWPRMVSPLNLSGALRRSARSWARSRSNSYTMSAKKLLVGGVWLRDLCRPRARGSFFSEQLTGPLGFVFSSTGAETYTKIENVRVLVLKTATWRRAGFVEAVLVEHVCVARNVVAAASSRVAYCCFLVR